MIANVSETSRHERGVLDTLVAASDEERAARQAYLQQAEADFESIPFDANAACAFGRVAASLRGSGRKTTARSYDAMMAATAIANELPLDTCNRPVSRKSRGSK